MPSKLKTFVTPSKQEVQVCIDDPSQFILEHQQQLLPGWNSPVAHIVLLLQQSNISLRELNTEVIQEKDRLRAKFIRFGCDLIFLLRDQGYESDLFDPRDGYPLLTQRGNMTLNDNAVVKALLNYPVASYRNCSLINHPTWGDRVYPSTIATNAPQDMLESLIEKLLVGQRLRLYTL